VPVGRPEAATGRPTGDTRLRERLSRNIDDFGLSVRSLNSLKNSNIRTLADLVAYTEDELLKVKNVGEKALGEISDLLQKEKLNFGMQFEEVDGEFRVVRPGTPPTMRTSVETTEG
jgi:DNA-directed RNA polymerase subunit alpha